MTRILLYPPVDLGQDYFQTPRLVKTSTVFPVEEKLNGFPWLITEEMVLVKPRYTELFLGAMVMKSFIPLAVMFSVMEDL